MIVYYFLTCFPLDPRIREDDSIIYVIPAKAGTRNNRMWIQKYFPYDPEIDTWGDVLAHEKINIF